MAFATKEEKKRNAGKSLFSHFILKISPQYTGEPFKALGNFSLCRSKKLMEKWGETDFVPGDSVPRYFVPRFCAWRFCAQEIMCLVDFVPIFDFVPGRFCAQDILCPGFLFCAQMFNFLRSFVPNEISCAWKILCLRRFCAQAWRFCAWRFCAWRFCAQEILCP